MIETGTHNYGGVGVDIFFVISGFIIYFVTRKNSQHFLMKRAIRIVPLYWLSTFGVAIVALIQPSLLKTTAFDLNHLILSLFFIPHFSEVQGFKPLLALGWTLNYEVTFYLLFALAMFIKHQQRLAISIILLLGLWTVTHLLPIRATSGIAFYQNPVFLEFIFGMIIAHFLYGKQLQTNRTILILLVSTLTLFLTITIWKPTGIRLVDYGLPSALLFSVFLISEPLFLNARVLRQTSIFGGEISYALYLIHMYFVAVLSRVLHLNGLGLWSATLIIVPLSSWLIYRQFEMPMTNFLRKHLL
jgi:peptidoglycan/LPS O-acetylase OafA/YrhL